MISIVRFGHKCRLSNTLWLKCCLIDRQVSNYCITGGTTNQRISIARAIMKDSPIIILDEATANVDPEDEAELTKAIEELTIIGAGSVLHLFIPVWLSLFPA